MIFSELHVFLEESGLSESSTQLLKKLGKLSTGFLRLSKVFSVYVFRIRFICVQNVMLATL